MQKPELQRLDEWEAALGRELEALRTKRNQLDRELQRVGRKLELVRQMRALEEAPASEGPEHTAQIAGTDSKATPSGVREMARKILSEAARPLHISEIHRAFLDRQYPIPGRGTPLNILAHLVNDKDFVRVARGTYALTGSVPEEQVLRKTPRSRKQ